MVRPRCENRLSRDRDPIALRSRGIWPREGVVDQTDRQPEVGLDPPGDCSDPRHEHVGRKKSEEVVIGAFHGESGIVRNDLGLGEGHWDIPPALAGVAREA